MTIGHPAPQVERHVRTVVPADHPALAGHFPGRPIVPAVVLLAEIRRHLPAEIRLTGIERAKFLRLVQPGMALRIGYLERGDGRTDVVCAGPDGAAMVQARLLTTARCSDAAAAT